MYSVMAPPAQDMLSAPASEAMHTLIVCSQSAESWQQARFFKINISQGSAATYLRCSGIFKYDFVPNLLVSPQVKEF